MTIIAYRAGLMAADSLLTSPRGIRVGSTPKIVKCPIGAVAGACGVASGCTVFLNWARGQGKGSSGALGHVTADEDFEGVIAYPNGVVEYYDNSGESERVDAKFHALGIGREIAMGAMDQGASAEEAVKAAIRHSVHCGGAVLVLRVERPIKINVRSLGVNSRPKPKRR